MFDKIKKYFASMSPNRIDLAVTALLTVFGYLVFYTYVIKPPNDMTHYMCIAMNLVSGNGLVETDGGASFVTAVRPPLFTYLLASAFQLSEPSYWNAYWVVRFFCILTPVGLYWAGRILVGRPAALAASLLALTSYTIAYWSYRHLDASWPVFAVAGMALTVAALEKKNRWTLVAAGLCFGLAFWLKELAIVFFPFPVLYTLLVKKYRKRHSFYISGIISAIMALAILGWMLYSKHLTRGIVFPIQNIGGLSSYMLPPGSREGIPNLIAVLFHWGKGLLNVLVLGKHSGIMKGMVLMPLVIVSWFYIFIRGIRGDSRAVALGLGLTLYFPLLVFFGLNHFRIGQSLPAILLSYLALGSALYAAVQALTNRFGLSNLKKNLAVILTTVFLLILQIVGIGHHKWIGDAGLASFMKMKRSLLHQIVTGGEFKKEVKGQAGARKFKKILTRLETRLEPGDKLLFEYNPAARFAFFRLKGRHQIYYYPLAFCSPHSTGNFLHNYKAYSLWKEFAEYPGGKELHGVYYHRALASYLPGTVAIVYEELFLEFIRRHNIKYIVTLDRLPGFHKVLDRHPAFRRVGAPVKTGSGSWSFTFRIYTFDPSRGQTGLSDTPPVISSSLAKTLESLQKNDPARLQQLLNNMSSSAGLSDQNKLKKELGLKPDKKK